MDEAKAEQVRKWLTKASHDLDAAKALASDEIAILDAASYHCQQAAEKALKGYLAFHDQSTPKTHDIGELLERAGELEDGFHTWSDAADRLTPLATRYRYPSIDDQPGRKVVEEAIEDAEAIVRQVLAFLPEDLHP
ncbi:MAG TPA: HEPN domain-containing protein [Isosphaeraceae bacterium]|jgi:HEPN domain-containing protein|nr:HEPN domain-containing protein [Isosphaeraceae bacterium]